MKRRDSIWSKYHSDPLWTEYPEGSMFSALNTIAKKFPDYTALEFGGIKMSFKKLIERIESLAKGLYSLGLRKGDFMSIVSPNTLEGVIAVYAANRIGVCVNMLHPLLSASEMQDFIERVDSKAILILDQIYPKIKKLKWKDKSVKIILYSIEDEFPPLIKFFYGISHKAKYEVNPEHFTVKWKDLNRKCQLPPDDGKNEDPAAILYSGGTTGTQKGALFTNFNFNVYPPQLYELYEKDKSAGIHALAVMPIFHGYGLGICIHGLLCNALHVFLVPKYDMEECSDLIFKRKISFLYGVPALYQAISRSEWIEKEDLSFLKLLVSSGDTLPEKLRKRMDRYLEKGGAPTRMRNAYGQTECVSGCAIMPFFKYKEKSVGLPFGEIDIEICDPDTNKKLDAGVSGEICVSGPTLMKGYYKDPEATAKALRVHEDGRVWLHTGDMGHMDEEGYLYYDARMSRMVITSGYNVYPPQVEGVIAKYPAIKECCVIGVPDEVLGQKVVAFVVPNGEEYDEKQIKEDLLKHCKDNLAEYSLPKDFVIVKSLPRSSIQKVDFKALEREYANK